MNWYQLQFLIWCRQSTSPTCHAQIPELLMLSLPMGIHHLTHNYSPTTNIKPFWKDQVCPQDEAFQGGQPQLWPVCTQGPKPGKRGHRSENGQHDHFTAQGCWSNFLEWWPENTVSVCPSGKEKNHWPLHSGKSLHFQYSMFSVL